MRAEGGGGGKGKKKRKEKEEKMGIKVVFLCVFCMSTRRIFHMRSGQFSNI